MTEPEHEPAAVRTSPALQPPPGNPRFPLFDSLRGIAVLMVIVFHAAGSSNVSATSWPGAVALQLFSGVMIFFALSGFLIYRPYVAARAAGRPAPKLRTFARRRALRILPAYWIALSVLATFGAINGVDRHDWWRYYGFLQIYDERTFSLGIPVAWSLCVEMTFYLAVPVYAWLLTRLSRTRRWQRVEGLSFLLLVAGSLVFRGAVRAGSVEPVLASSLAGMGTFFAIGMGLAATSVALQTGGGPSRLAAWAAHHPTVCWILSGGSLFVAATAFGVSNYSELERSWVNWYGNYVGVAMATLFLLIPAVVATTHTGVPHRILRTRLLSWIGLVSYGLFLWHLPLLVRMANTGLIGDGLARFPTLLIFTVAAGLAAAAASYALVELPFLRLKEPRRSSSSA